MTTLPASIDETVLLPARYEAARSAIAACDDVDECQQWADKARALAAYARMAKDDTMRLMALRIQARAQRRAGELLKQIQPATGAHLKSDGADTLSRRQAAEDAGLSDRQRLTSIRLANVPTAEFERAIESATPPTVTQLAERGTRHRPEASDIPALADPADVSDTHSALTFFAEFCAEHDAASVARSIVAIDAKSLRGFVSTIDRWLDRFVTNLPSSNGGSAAA